MKEIWDQLTSIGATPDQELMGRTALNAVLEDWEVFVQSILGRVTLLNWEELWAASVVETAPDTDLFGSSGVLPLRQLTVR